MFGRRKKATDGEIDQALEIDAEGFVDDLDEESRAAEDLELLRLIEVQEEAERRERGLSPQGPWDVADAPPLPDGHGRLDLGAIQVTVEEGLEVRLDMNDSGEVAAVTFLHADSAGQVLVFAAPRTRGIWDEVRAEIAAALEQGPGRATETNGAFGPELHAMVPADPAGQGGLAPARFLGVDGPRWFARLLLTGRAAQDEAAAAPLLAAFRGIVVVRGDEAMPAREPLALSLPPEAVQPQVGDVEGDQVAEQPGLQMPARGPEISEVR